MSQDLNENELFIPSLDEDTKEVDKVKEKALGEKKDTEVLSKKKRKRKRKQVDLGEEDAEDEKLEAVDKTKNLTKPDGFTVIGVDKFKKKQKVCLFNN